MVLEGHGDTHLNQLAERLAVTPSTALRTVDRLIGVHLVTRQENNADRVEVLIALTSEEVRLVRERSPRDGGPRSRPLSQSCPKRAARGGRGAQRLHSSRWRSYTEH